MGRAGARVLMVTQWFDPEPVLKGVAFCRSLSRLGFEVEVVTGFPNYPGGKVYDGYSVRPHAREEHDGVRVHRTWLYPSHDRSPLRRAANYFSFSASSLVAGLSLKKPDVVYAYHPPATVGWTAALLAKRFGAPLVLDVQDLWPDTVASSRMMSGGAAMRLLEALCSWEYGAAARVVTSAPGLADVLASRSVQRERLRVIRNWADESKLSAPPAQAGAAARATLGSGFSVLFAGQMGVAQGLDTVLDAAALATDVRWVLLGDGTERARLERAAADRKLTNVVFHPRVPMSEVGAWLDEAGALLVHLEDDPLFKTSIPSKTQAYLRAGRPVLMAVRGDAAKVVEAAGAGLTCAPQDARALAAAAQRLAAMDPAERQRLGERGRAYYERELSFEAGVGAFAALFDEVITEAEARA